MQSKKAKSKSKTHQWPNMDVLTKYRMYNTNNIRLYILWFHVQALMNSHYPDVKEVGTEQWRSMEQFKRDWHELDTLDKESPLQ